MEQEKQEQNNITQSSVTSSIAKEQPWQDPWDMHLSIWESLPDIDLKKVYRESSLGKVLVAVMSAGATAGLYSLYEKIHHDAYGMSNTVSPAVRLGATAVAIAGSLGLCELVAGKESCEGQEQKTVWRRACDYVYADTGVVYPSIYYDRSLSSADRSMSGDIVKANQKKINQESLKGEHFKQALSEPTGQASAATMALGAATGLYSLYAQFQKDAYGAPFMAHPAVALGGLAVGIVGLVGLGVKVTEKVLDKLEQQPRETLDSWANKINAQREQEKEMVR
ncbi:MAG: hypothetical protein EAY65_03915 [Alphaproteobacteria bacterium]|nr:MAG: hypothetical protein EAY65_03915 [Alphaproteobacteria bacterium]